MPCVKQMISEISSKAQPAVVESVFAEVLVHVHRFAFDALTYCWQVHKSQAC
jgi:hypothetical protein